MSKCYDVHRHKENLMKIKELLSKSGVLRMGATSATYKSGKDRPTELLMDGVFDAKKDVITKGDLKKVKKVVSGTSKPGEQTGNIGRKIFFGIVVLLALLLAITYLGSGSFWTILFGVLLIALFLFFTYRFAFAGFYTWWLVVIAFVFFIIFGLILVPNTKDASSGSSSSVPAASYDELKQYDKKVIKITSADGTLVGTAGMALAKDSSGKPYLNTYYNMFITESLPKNGKLYNGIEVGIGYDYVNNLVDAKNESGEGALSAIFCNKEQPLKDPYNSGSQQYTCQGQNTRLLTTNTFLATFSRWWRSYDDFLQHKTYEIYDASNYWEEKKESNGTSTWSYDDDKVVAESSKVKTYNLQFE